MRLLLFATMAVLSLLAPTEAMSIQDKLKSLTSRLLASEQLQATTAPLHNCSHATAPPLCNSYSDCHWVAIASFSSPVCLPRTGLARCDAAPYVNNKKACTQPNSECTWYVEDGKEQCIRGPGQACHLYTDYNDCEQVDNKGSCVFYYIYGRGRCLSTKQLLYKPYVFDCSGTHNSSLTTGYDASKSRNAIQCREDPIDNFCEWNGHQCVPREKPIPW